MFPPFVLDCFFPINSTPIKEHQIVDHFFPPTAGQAQGRSYDDQARAEAVVGRPAHALQAYVAGA